MERITNRQEQLPNQSRALSPQEIMDLKQEITPSIVLETVNRLIAENLNNAGYARITQNHIVSVLVANGLKEEEIYNKHWLDFEMQYREAGWEVKYDRPGYDENYDAYFVFTIPQSKGMGAAAVRGSMNHY